MRIRFGDCGKDVGVGELEPNDRLLIEVHGTSPVVTRGGADGPHVHPFLDDTRNDFAPRAFYHLLPFGEAQNFLYDSSSSEEDCAFDFYVRYGDGLEAVITLKAWLDDPIIWGVFVRVGSVTIDAGGLDGLNRDIGNGSVLEQFARGTVYEKEIYRTAEEGS